MRIAKRGAVKSVAGLGQSGSGPTRELSERLGCTAKQLLSQARPGLSLDLTDLARLLGVQRAR